MNTMLGVVLCGGASTRMGTDKGTYQHESEAWAQTCAQLFESIHLPYVISLRKKQGEVYQALFPSHPLVFDNDLAVFGPLKGIISVHQQYPAEDLMVLACDIPGMHDMVLQRLADEYNRQLQYDCYLFSTNGLMQPLCAIYRAARLKQLLLEIESGKLDKHSMMHFVEASHSLIMPAEKDWINYFENYNTPEDLSRLRK